MRVPNAMQLEWHISGFSDGLAMRRRRSPAPPTESAWLQAFARLFHVTRLDTVDVSHTQSSWGWESDVIRPGRVSRPRRRPARRWVVTQMSPSRKGRGRARPSAHGSLAQRAREDEWRDFWIVAIDANDSHDALPV